MESWLQSVFDSSPLTDEAEGYLLGRGVLESSIRGLKFGVWRSPDESAPDTGVFHKRYGEHGEYLNGRLFYPLFCPRGQLLGFEARTFVGEKKITRYLLYRGAWNPVFIGMPLAMPLIWEGKVPWLFEGVYDVEVMRHVLTDIPLLGTLRAKLTDKHVEFLRRFLPPGTSIPMVYDHDETGEKGIRKARYALREVDLDCRPIPYTKGKDPNQVWEDFGTTGLREAFGIL